ncbi:MAG: hypothetical protein AABW41_00370 [Nanoarchaeota archaeon]
MNKNIVIIVVLSVLVVISAVQAYELIKLKTDMSAGKVSIGSASRSTSVSTGESAFPSSTNELPEMVGGC